MEERAEPLRCYSRLRRILADQRMTVGELNRNLARRGIRVNLKTLYRLADPTEPIERLDTSIAGRICQVLKVDLAVLLTFEEVRRGIGLKKLARASQLRLDLLLERHARGKLSDADERELGELVEEAERLTLSNARMLARARQRSSAR